MKTVFFGTPDFALSSLEACRDKSQLVGVVTQPDRPRGRGQKLSPCPIKERALEWNLPAFSPASLRKSGEELSALEKFIAQEKPDLFVVTAYGNLLPQKFLDLTPWGAINLHASLLPRWRGAAPIQRSIENGDTETGVCLQRMVMDLDAGDVLRETRLPIGPNESALSLSERLSEVGGLLLRKFLMEPQWQGRAQNPELVTLATKIKKDEANWSPSWSSSETHARVRAFAAWPQVKARLKGSSLEMKILETQLFARAKVSIEAPSPGSMLLEDGKVYLGCNVRPGELSLELLKVQVPGKGPVRAWDYFQNLPGPLSLESL
ncbi:MAG: methionyl-tRNA formyltransferase [Bdellovibrionota bacterium]